MDSYKIILTGQGKMVILLLMLYGYDCAMAMHFPVNKLDQRVCDAAISPHIIDKSVPVSVQFPPIKYSFTGNETIFAIDPDTGILVLMMRLDSTNQSRFLLQKQATDSRGNSAVLEIDLSTLKSHLSIKQCPKLQQMIVKEITPIGEEIGQLECKSYAPNLFEKHRTVVNVSGGYTPVNITSSGVVIVNSPLHFRNYIDDIIIFNVNITHLKDNASHGDCRVTQAQLTIRILVKKAECPANWTYLPQINKVLDYPPLVSLTSVSTERCMETCSTLNSTPCNSLAYNLVRRSCDLYNETDVTVPKLVQERVGFFLYRKHCEMEILPKVSLRQLNIKINSFASLNTSVSEDLLCSLQSIIAEINMTHADRVFTAGLLYAVVANTTFNNSTHNMTTKYLKAVCELLDRFIENKITNGTSKEVKDIYQLILTFDTLMERLTSGLTSDHGQLEVNANHTHVRMQQAPSSGVTRKVDLVASGDVSRVILPEKLNGITENQHLLFITGAISIPDESLIAERLVEDGKPVKRHMTLSGHMISVNVRPYFSSMFVTPLQLDIFTPVPVDGSERVCVFLRLLNYSHHWRGAGCKMAAYNLTHARCQCDHLTNFAVLMQIRDFQVAKVHSASLKALTVIGCCISIVSLSTTVLILLWLRLQSDRYVLLMNLSVAIVMAHIVFLTGVDATHSKVICRLVAILLHYLYLAVFTLMLAEGIYLYQKLYRAFTSDTSITMFLLLGWGAPFIVVAISLLTDTEGYGTDKHCWLSTEGAIWAFVGPALTIISINTAILVNILQTFLGIKVNARKTDTEKFRASVRATVVLLPLLGLTWMFGVVAVNSSTVFFQYVFAILNSLQGLFIFLFHVVFNKEVRGQCNRYRAKAATMVYPVDLAPDMVLQARALKQSASSPREQDNQKLGVMYRKLSPVPKQL